MKKIKDLWQAKLLNKKDEFKDVESRMEEKIRVLESELSVKAHEMQDFEKMKQQLQQRLDDIERLERECSNHKNESSLQRIKNEELELDLKQQASKYDDLNENCAEQELELKRLQKNRSDLKEQVLDITSKLNASDGKLAESETKILDLEINIKKLKDGNEGQQREIDSLQDQIGGLKDKINEMLPIQEHEDIMNEQLQKIQSEQATMVGSMKQKYESEIEELKEEINSSETHAKELQ